MDCFYAAVEMRDNSAYRNIPLAVGGPVASRGVISTCNYIARRFGVHSAMPTAQAFKLCPNLTLVSGNMSYYKEISRQIRSIFLRYSSKIEPLSLDEAYIDVSDCPLFYNSATLIAEDIRKSIYQELGLTASAGVAPLKFLAKIASDINKPDGSFVISPDEVHDFIADLPLRKISGVGKVFARKLERLGLVVGQDVRNYNREELEEAFGKMGNLLYERIHGYDDREILVERVRKSIGVEKTLKKNVSSFEDCWLLIEKKLYPELCDRLARVQSHSYIAKHCIKLKFADFQQTSIEHAQNELELEGFSVLLKEILQRQQGREIRLIGISVALVLPREKKQLSLPL